MSKVKPILTILEIEEIKRSPKDAPRPWVLSKVTAKTAKAESAEFTTFLTSLEIFESYECEMVEDSKKPGQWQIKTATLVTGAPITSPPPSPQQPQSDAPPADYWAASQTPAQKPQTALAANPVIDAQIELICTQAENSGFSRATIILLKDMGKIPVEAVMQKPHMVVGFLAICQARHLNPLLNEAYLLPFNTKDKAGNFETSFAIVSGIDGNRKLCSSTGSFMGADEPLFDGQPMWKWLTEQKTSDGKIDKTARPMVVSVTVYRKVDGEKCSFTVPILWDEYFPDKRDFKTKQPKSNGKWDSAWANQIRKCAEQASLRQAFGDALQGLGIPEEFDRDRTAPQMGGEELTTIAEINAFTDLHKLQEYKRAHDKKYHEHNWFRDAFHNRVDELRNIVVQDGVGSESQEFTAAEEAQ